ncbi:MAG: immunoglobulin domain-containing protein [Cytophagaceae bacterium]|jgi:hypothetical protein|nr:immunoglobulin domain-containing protein [Cytophagaceae bacterium]
MRLLNFVWIGLFALYISSGNAQTYQSVTHIGGIHINKVIDIQTDAAGNTYIVGNTRNTISTPTNSGLGSSSTKEQTFLAKINSSGTVAWLNHITTGAPSAISNAIKIKVDNSGNVFMACNIASTATYFQPFFNVNSALNVNASSARDGALAKYNSNGGLIWVRGFGDRGVGEDQITDMELDSNGDVYVTGFVNTGSTIYGRDMPSGAQTTLANLTVTGSLDGFVVKFNGSGVLQWNFLLGGAGADKATALTVDASDNIYVAGRFFGTVDMNQSGATNNAVESVPQGTGDAYIAKYTSAGSYTWHGAIEGVNEENINSLHVGSSGLLNVGGYVQGTNLAIDFDMRGGASVLTRNTVDNMDGFVAQYNLSTQAPIFVKILGGSLKDSVSKVAGDGSGNLYVTGIFNGSNIEFNRGGTTKLLSSVGAKDIFISKYNTSTGDNAWAYNLGGTADDVGTAVDITASGEIWFSGYFASSTCGDFDPGAGTQSLTNLGVEDGYIVKYSECTGASITSQPTNFTGCTGATIALSITATGSGISYQWQKDGTNLSNGGGVSGATTASLSIAGASSANNGSYRCVVTSACGSINSTAATVTINTAPSITTHPTNQSVCSGANVSFGVVASGTGLSYQWQRNGVNITNNAVYAGTSAATLNITGATIAEAGSFTCIVTGSCTPSATSNAAILSISSLPSITTSPSSIAACLGANVNFTVVASGSGITYQWQKNGVAMSNGGSISGVTTASLSITGVVAGDAANYTCVVSGTCTPSVTSSIAALTITAAPTITTSPSNQTLCSGNNVSFSVTASGSGLSYQWQKGGVNISNGGNVSGATTSTLTLTSITTADAASYQCIVTGACAPTATSATATLTVNAVPTIVTPPSSASICSGQNTSFTVVATGTGLTYQWQKDGVSLSNNAIYTGVTTSTLSLTAASVSEAGNYRCIVSGTCTPAATSAVAILTVGSTAAITGQPTSATLCAGQNASFTVTTSGSGITYQWQKNGVNLSNGGSVSGVTTAVLSIASIVSADAGNYRCIVSNACAGSLTSSVGVLTVNALPAITTQPTDVTICAASNVSFTVVATGTSITYQWRKNGIALSNGGSISGVTTSTLSITSAGMADAGNYDCVVSGSCTPPVTSTSAVLSVGSLATITGQPSNLTICSGSNAAFTVTVSGTGNTFQWKKNGVNISNGGRFSGATTSTLTITGALSADADTYTCETGNACSGVLTSAAALLTIQTLPSITTQPTNQSVCSGSTASFTVVATGTGISYQWKKNGVNLTDGGSISGTSSATLIITGVVSGDAGNYSCDVSGACSPSASSSAAALSVSNSVSILTQPSNQAICSGTNAVFTVVAGGGSLTYQWKKDGVALSDGGTISGSATASLIVSSSTALDAGSYVCEVTSACGGTISSSAAILSITTSITITSQPTSTIQCEGTNAVLTVVASGTGLSYVWKKDGTTVVDGGSVSGATTATLTITSLTLANTGSYVCDITGSCGVTSTTAATLTTHAQTVITTQPASSSACPGSSILFSVAANGASLTYSWLKDGSTLSDGGSVSGSSTATLTLSSLSGTDEATYSCVVTGVCGPAVTSTGAVLTLATPPVITDQPDNLSACVGQPGSFTILISNPTGAIYVWKKNGVTLTDGGTISGATTNTLSIASIALSDAGNYTCEVALTCTGTTTSSTAVLTVGATGAITQHPINANICLNQGAVFSVTYSGSGALFQWQFKSGSNPFVNISNGGAISGATSANLILTTAVLANQGSYRCVVTESCGNVLNTNAAALIINTPQIIVQPFSQSVCIGQPTFLSVTASGQNLTYQWFKNGVAVVNGSGISGATTASLTISNSQAATAGDYTCRVSGICSPPALSDVATVTASVCTSVQLTSTIDARVYPNPVVSNATLEIKDRLGKTVEVTIISTVGTIVYSTKQIIQNDIQQIELPMESLPSALYLIHIRMGEQVQVERVERLP